MPSWCSCQVGGGRRWPGWAGLWAGLWCHQLTGAIRLGRVGLRRLCEITALLMPGKVGSMCGAVHWREARMCVVETPATVVWPSLFPPPIVNIPSTGPKHRFPNKSRQPAPAPASPLQVWARSLRCTSGWRGRTASAPPPTGSYPCTPRCLPGSSARCVCVCSGGWAVWALWRARMCI